MMIFSAPTRRRQGFTLLELLIVIVVIGVLMGLLLPAVLKVQTGMKRQRASAAARVIRNAVETYHTQYKRWPVPESHSDAGGTITYGVDGQPNSVVANRLFYPPDGDPPATGHPQPGALLDPKHIRLDSQGNLLDPWEGPYEITINLSYDSPGQRVSVSYNEPP